MGVLQLAELSCVVSVFELCRSAGMLTLRENSLAPGWGSPLIVLLLLNEGRIFLCFLLGKSTSVTLFQIIIIIENPPSMPLVTHSQRNGSSSSSVAVARLSTFTSKQRRMKFFAMLDSSSGMVGCVL